MVGHCLTDVRLECCILIIIIIIHICSSSSSSSGSSSSSSSSISIIMIIIHIGGRPLPDGHPPRVEGKDSKEKCRMA